MGVPIFSTKGEERKENKVLKEIIPPVWNYNAENNRLISNNYNNKTFIYLND